MSYTVEHIEEIKAAAGQVEAGIVADARTGGAEFGRVLARAHIAAAVSYLEQTEGPASVAHIAGWYASRAARLAEAA
jgi:hypothetical protein